MQTYLFYIFQFLTWLPTYLATYLTVISSWSTKDYDFNSNSTRESDDNKPAIAESSFTASSDLPPINEPTRKILTTKPAWGRNTNSAIHVSVSKGTELADLDANYITFDNDDADDDEA